MTVETSKVNIRYRIARPQELGVLARLAAESFDEYPFFAFAFRDHFETKKAYLDCMTRLDRMVIRTYISKKICLVGECDGRVTSLGLLDDPRAKAVGLSDYVMAGGLSLIKDVGLRRLLEFFDISERAQKACKLQHPQAWYLEMLAVDTHLKGQGLGTRMIHECLIPYTRFHNGRTLSLITNTEQNRRFYTTNGFEEFSEMHLHSHGNTIGNWSFFRDLDS